METSKIFLLATTLLCWYSLGASWLLQIVAYPTYKQVGEKEFVAYHTDFGNRLLKTSVIPMILTNIMTFIFIFYHPDTVPMGLVYLTALCSGIILFTTVKYEVPKHQQLDKEGKSDSGIDYLVKNNLPRSICWTVAALSLGYMVLKSM